MKICLLMNHNSYPGREYMEKLLAAGIPFEVASIGSFPGYSEIENERCGNRWQPRPFNKLIANLNHSNFSSLKDESLINLLRDKQFDMGIQGGTGIIPHETTNLFRLGILNFHPGDLPRYRGCSAPEWQLLENNPIVCTCHLLDSGIDSGDIYKKTILSYDYHDYHSMRAGLYPEIAKFVAEVVGEIWAHGEFLHKPIKQNQDRAEYRKYIGEERLSLLIQKLENKNDRK